MQTTIDDLCERRDIALEQAFLAATDGAITAPNSLQRALFPLLSSQDIGLLVESGPAAGRLESVFVPVMTGSRNGSQLQRLFIIVADGMLTDDYTYRLGTYLRSLAVEQGQPLTLFVEGELPLCRQYSPSGGYQDDTCDHPLDVLIDVVVATFTRFRTLFFGSGGVHAIPGALEGTGHTGIDFELRRRDLYYFDEAQSYERDEFSGFVTLVEFLYAEDMDVLVGATTLPAQLRDELSFLEELDVDLAAYQPPRTIKFLPEDGRSYSETAKTLAKANYVQNSRLGIVFEDGIKANDLYCELAQLYPKAVYAYLSGSSRETRQITYAHLRELEKEGEGYLLITDGFAIESSDLDVNILITGICAPESLVRRAGHCNRRGDITNGEMIVVDSGGYQGRRFQTSRLEQYLTQLKSAELPIKFVARDWSELSV